MTEMANRTEIADQSKTLNPQTTRSSDDENELEKLESDVKIMGLKLLEYRTTLPVELQNTLASILAAQRPVNLTYCDHGSEPGPSDDPNPGARRPLDSGRALLVVEDQELAEKLQRIKHKISSTATAMPLLLKRMKDGMSRIDKLDTCNEVIHPAFKRKRTI